MEPLNRERIEGLSKTIVEALREHLAHEPYGPHQVYEALNAVGLAAAIIMAAIPDEDHLGLVMFFGHTIHQQLEKDGIQIIVREG